MLVQLSWSRSEWPFSGWFALHPCTILVYLRDRTTWANVHAATLRQKLWIKHTISPSYSIPTQGQLVLAPTLTLGAWLGSPWSTSFMSLVQLDKVKTPWVRQGLKSGVGIMEANNRQVTTAFTVQPSFHHQHSTNRVPWSVTIVSEGWGEVWLHFRNTLSAYHEQYVLRATWYEETAQAPKQDSNPHNSTGGRLGK